MCVCAGLCAERKANRGMAEEILSHLSMSLVSLENQMRSVVNEVEKLSCRVESLERVFTSTQNISSTNSDYLRLPCPQHVKPSKRPRFMDSVKVLASDEDMSLLKSRVLGPVKDIVTELGKEALMNDEIALHFLRVSSNRQVALQIFEAEEMANTFRSIRWESLSPFTKDILSSNFVKVIAKVPCMYGT